MYYGGLLQYMEYNNTPVYFTHAPDGTPMGMLTGGKAYFYIVNLQGDVTGIVDQTGNLLVSYTYDAWGNPLSTTLADGNTYAPTVAALNPLRYRGYVYDAETGLYYLQSRYYNPEIGRFLNADGYTTTGQGFVGNNMFAYCNNSVVDAVDVGGAIPKELSEFGFVPLLVEDDCSSGHVRSNEILVVSNSAWMASSNTMGKDLASAIDADYIYVFAANYTSFISNWNKTTANYVIIHTHGTPTTLSGEDRFLFGVVNGFELSCNKNIEYVIMTSCSTGAPRESGQNIGQLLSTKISPTGYVICSTTDVWGDDKMFWPDAGGRWVVYQNGMLVNSSIQSKITMSYIADYIRHHLK